jgi:hypothetical protein
MGDVVEPTGHFFRKVGYSKYDVTSEIFSTEYTGVHTLTTHTDALNSRPFRSTYHWILFIYLTMLLIALNDRLTVRRMQSLSDFRHFPNILLIVDD